MRPNYEFNPMLYPSNSDAWFNAGCRGTVSNDVAATGRYVGGGRGKRFIRNNKTRNNKTRNNKTRNNKSRNNKSRNNKTRKAKMFY